MKIEIFRPQVFQSIGQRTNQEDAFYPQIENITENDRLFMVCDGMGGHEKGEVASNTVSTAMAKFISSQEALDVEITNEVLAQALEYAYKQLDLKDDGAAKKMGTTLTLVYLGRKGIIMAHMGDSRIYHIRPADKSMRYMSRDHSLVFDQYQAGLITFDETYTSPQKNVITKAVMPGQDNRSRMDIVKATNIIHGDYFYLCSDGMTEKMRNDEITQLFSEGLSDDEIYDRLEEATRENADNHTAIFFRIKRVEREPGDEYLDDEEATSLVNAMNIHPVMDHAEAEQIYAPQQPTYEQQPIPAPIPQPITPQNPTPSPTPAPAPAPAPVNPQTSYAPRPTAAATTPRKKNNVLLPIICGVVALAAVACLVWFLFLKGPSEEEKEQVRDAFENVEAAQQPSNGGIIIDDGQQGPAPVQTNALPSSDDDRDDAFEDHYDDRINMAPNEQQRQENMRARVPQRQPGDPRTGQTSSQRPTQASQQKPTQATQQKPTQTNQQKPTQTNQQPNNQASQKPLAQPSGQQQQNQAQKSAAEKIADGAGAGNAISRETLKEGKSDNP